MILKNHNFKLYNNRLQLGQVFQFKKILKSPNNLQRGREEEDGFKCVSYI